MEINGRQVIMCSTIVINRGELEIETPKQFKDHFKFEPIKNNYYNSIYRNCCLCQIDIEETLKQNNIPFKTDCGDYYVGMLDEVIGDND